MEQDNDAARLLAVLLAIATITQTVTALGSESPGGLATAWALVAGFAFLAWRSYTRNRN